MLRFLPSAIALGSTLVIAFTVASCGPSRVAGVASVGVSADGSDDDASLDGGAMQTQSDDATSDAGGETSAPGDSPCADACTVLAGTSCPPDPASCPANCAAQIADLCGDQSRALLACQAGLSPADFTCDSRGRLVMDPSKCQAESDALVQCLLGG